jgi:hypothetical protein
VRSATPSLVKIALTRVFTVFSETFSAGDVAVRAPARDLDQHIVFSRVRAAPGGAPSPAATRRATSTFTRT